MRARVERLRVRKQATKQALADGKSSARKQEMRQMVEYGGAVDMAQSGTCLHRTVQA